MDNMNYEELGDWLLRISQFLKGERGEEGREWRREERVWGE